MPAPGGSSAEVSETQPAPAVPGPDPSTGPGRRGSATGGAEAAEAAVRAACDDVRDGGTADHVDGVVPRLVAHPGSTEEVGTVMAAAAAHGLTVVPRGRGTRLSWGRPPTSADLVVDVSRLDRVVDHAAGDLVVVVQAGARLRDVQETLAGERQQLAVDEMAPGTSIGGSVAVAASGPRRHVVGTLRDLMIGTTVVRADGVVAHSGGRVVKNVAGYDLGKLLVGSFGTLGIVTEAVFRLHPVAEVRRWVTVPAADAGTAHRLVHAVVHSQAVPTAVELDQPAGRPGSVQVLLEGREDGVTGRTRTVRDLLGPGAEETDEAPAGWAAYPWDGDAPQGTQPTALKLTTVLSGLRDVAEEARQVGAHLRGSAGTGVLHASVEDPSRAPDAVARLRAVCARHGGTLVVLDAPREVEAAVDVWGPVPALDLMRRLKDRFDPDHRLAPGRFVGGI